MHNLKDSAEGGEVGVMISELTKDCPREDCRISANGPSVSTCMGWTPTFDKRGNRTDHGDPNISRSAYVCATCGSHWSVSNQYGKTKSIVRLQSENAA